MRISNNLLEFSNIQLGALHGLAYSIFGSLILTNLLAGMDLMVSECKELAQCFKESSNKFQKINVRFSTSSTLNSKSNMDCILMPYKFMIK